MRWYRVGTPCRIEDNRCLVTSSKGRKLEGISGLIVKRLWINIVAFCRSDPTLLGHHNRHWVCAG